MFCTNCGTEYQTNARFCHQCGMRLAEDAQTSMPDETSPDAPAPRTESVRPAGMFGADDVAGPVPAENASRRQFPARQVGLVLMVVGVLVAIYFFLFFDTSVEVPSQAILGTMIGGGRVNNLGLMADRQNGIIVGFGVAFIGGVVLLLNRGKK